MGKQGPCYHCGVTSTPLWRNGPPEKPVLCNACGSRWRTKGTLANYTPLHARAEPDDYEEHRVRVKSISINKNKEVKLLKRKQYHDNVIGGIAPDYNQGFRKVMDEDTSNRSSSGSAVSNSESCAQFGSMDASDLTGPAQSVVWESMVPSKKRTCFNRPKVSSVEKLTKDLYTILHEQQSSCISVSSEDDLLYESETPMVSVEIGHGSVLIRHPSSIARDEESEASSLSVDNKLCLINEAYSHSSAFPVHNASFPSRMIDKYKDPTVQGMHQYQLKRDKSQHDKLQLLGSDSSPLQYIDIEDVLNFEEFSRQLTNEEQQQLLKFLPQVDTTNLPDSLMCMFDSPQLKENISSFKQLLVEGVFDTTLSGVKTEDCKTLKRFALSNLTKSQWVEHYLLLKKCKQPVASDNVLNLKKSGDGQNQKFSEARTIMKSSKKVAMKGGNYESREPIDNDGSCFSPRSLFALPTDGSTLMLDSFQFVGESSDQDLLLDVPSNNSFPQAELLHASYTYGAQQASTSSSTMYSHLARP